MAQTVMITLTILLGAAATSHAGSWSYDGSADGPDQWASLFSYCGGAWQSPIDIKAAETVYKSFDPFAVTNYDTAPTTNTIANNGHSVQVTSTTSNIPKISGGGLSGDYTFAQYHFHWGSQNGYGSEHTADGKSFPLEMHIVTYKSSYGDLATAVANPDGLAVFGVVFEVVPDEDPMMEIIVDDFVDITTAETSVDTTETPTLRDLLPTNTADFIRYQGSLTTPTCNEVVTWTLFTDPLPISNVQLEKFRTLKDSHGHAIEDNNRPVQPVGDRTVYRSFQSMVGSPSLPTLKH